MKSIAPLLIVASILACGGLHAEETANAKAEAAEQDEADARLPAIELTPKLLYQFLLAEIAGQRGQMTNAAELFQEIAKQTHDPRIARRATEIALHGRRMETALQAAQLWVDIEPASAQARQTLISLLATEGRYDELKVAVEAFLASEPQQVGTHLMRMNRLFARGGDRKGMRELVEAVTTPYLKIPEAHYARTPWPPTAPFCVRSTSSPIGKPPCYFVSS
jgi:tetratricopeptide (TPR) repeat protein